MLELGVAAPAQHRAIGQLAAELGFFYLALTGHYAQETAQAAKKHGMNPEHVLVFADPQTMGRWCAALLVQGTLSHGDWILVKGSRGMRMEGFIEVLEQELHQAPAQGANHAL
jgi:UDP-N-acetylmuramyl pentapeptide synthase